MSRLRETGRRALVPFVVWAIAAAVYSLVAGPRLSHPTADNHFVHLADSFLHGQLGVVGNTPPGTNDWACYDVELHVECAPGAFTRPRDSHRWYVSFPPVPALVLVPFVALFGLDIPDALIWSLFAGLAPCLLYLVLRRLREDGKSGRSEREDLVLVALYAFGTVFFFTAVQGTVWFAGHVVGSVLLAAFFLFAIDARRPVAAGLILGLAFMTRPTTALFALFFLVEAIRVSRKDDAPVASEDASVAKRLFFWVSGARGADVIKRVALFAAPVLVIGVIAMWMNEARFEDPFEFGHRYLVIYWRDRIERWGLFSYHYFARNLAIYVASLPWYDATREPHWIISRHGLALWLTTPTLLLVFFPRRRMDATATAIAVCAAAVALWNLLYQNSGWIQFGYRFSNDYLIALFVLLALGQRRFRGGFALAMAFAIAINLFGALTFDRAWQFYDDDGSQQRLFQPD
jgi:hypothetical protein